MHQNPNPTKATAQARRLVATDTPGIYRRGSRYVAMTRHKGRQVKTYHRTKALAKSEKGRRDSGGVPTDRERFEVYAEHWLTHYQGRTAAGITPEVLASYRYMLEHYAYPYFHGRKIGEITPLDVKQYIDHLTRLTPQGTKDLTRRLAPASVRRILSPLKAMLAEAYELGVSPVDASRVRIVVKDRRGQQAPKAMTPEEVRGVLNGLDARDRLLFAFLAATGLRIGEALGLQWRDLRATDLGDVIDVRRIFLQGQLRDRTKTTESARTVALLPTPAAALREAQAETRYPAALDPIFATVAGTHRDANNVRRRLRPAAQAAGVPWVTPHVFRHTLASTMRDHGHDADTIAKVLGHTDADFTRRTYIHIRDAPRFDDLDAFAITITTTQ